MDWVNAPLGPTKKNLKSLGGIWAEQCSVEILVESIPPRQLSSILEPVRNRVKHVLYAKFWARPKTLDSFLFV